MRLTPEAREYIMGSLSAFTSKHSATAEEAEQLTQCVDAMLRAIALPHEDCVTIVNYLKEAANSNDTCLVAYEHVRYHLRQYLTLDAMAKSYLPPNTL